ncbi:hypothetical protein MM188_003193 [Vibrio cholerae]|nr:hypothetical protein [Vibrio cholerae]
MAVQYYKSTNLDPFMALSAYEAEREAYKAEFEAFAEKFDAKAVFVYDHHGMRFYGLDLKDFEKREDQDLWRKPDARYNRASRIRSSVRSKGNTERLNALKGKYQSLLPSLENPSRAAFYESLGVSWGDLFFCGLKWFKHNQVVYLATGLKLTKNVTEILGSEYAEAERANDSESDFSWTGV